MLRVEYQLEPKLKRRAESIMACSWGPQGEDYLRSGLKRKLDVVVSTVGLTCPSPFIAMAAVLVYLQDLHNPFFDGGFANPVTGEVASFWKIRTMKPNSKLLEAMMVDNGRFYSAKVEGRDHRVTPVGRLLRRTSIDELPQFWNVLKGDFSVVCPRKYTDAEWHKLILPTADKKLLEEFEGLLKGGMKFGLTGLATVLARNNQDADAVNKRLALHVFYGQNANFIADLKIIGLTLTPGVLFQGR